MFVVYLRHSRGTMTISTLEPAHSSAVLPVDANRAPEGMQTTCNLINNNQQPHSSKLSGKQSGLSLLVCRKSKSTNCHPNCRKKSVAINARTEGLLSPRTAVSARLLKPSTTALMPDTVWDFKFTQKESKLARHAL